MAVEYKDYYKILGVDKGASEKEIKQAYRRLARKYHPDVNPGDNSAEERFKEIGEAYAVLGDPDKRKKYDQFGPSLRDGTFWRQGASPGGRTYQSSNAGRVYTDVRDFARDFDAGGLGGGFSDFFQALFGQGFGRGRTAEGPAAGNGAAQAQAAALRGADIEQAIEVTLEEVASGGNRVFSLQV